MGTFYPVGTKQKDRFSYYQKFFKTVELNSPFYHLPPRQTFEKWKADVPNDFVYAVKASRFITHMKKLNDAGDSLTRLLDNAAGLDEKLSIILFQLPPNWEVDIERFKIFLEKLPKGSRYTFEFRNPTWYNDEVYSLLKKYNCAFCIYELAGHLSPYESRQTMYTLGCMARAINIREVIIMMYCTSGQPGAKSGQRKVKMYMFILITTRKVTQPLTLLHYRKLLPCSIKKSPIGDFLFFL